MIKETIILPSQGFPYNGRLEGTSVTVRPLTTRVYKDFIVNPSEEGIVNLVDSCLVDCPIKSNELVYQDQLAVYLKIRSISLGNLVPAYSICPHCNKRNDEKWDIMKLDCNYLSLEEYPYGVVLPDCKKKVYISIPTPKSQTRANEEAKKRATLFDKKISDFLPSFQIASVIRVDGVNDIVEKAEWYNELTLKDAVFIDSVMEKLQDFGIVTSRMVTCQSCNKEYSVPVHISQDFFRPDIGNISGFKTSPGTLEKGPTDTDEAKQDS